MNQVFLKAPEWDGLFPCSLRGNFFQCHVFAMKSVQNLWRSSQNYFVLALFSSL
jgi:hypothetical protein